MLYQSINVHSVLRFTAHIIWATKYRCPVLEGDIQIRCCSLIIQIYEAEDTPILTVCTSKRLQIEFPYFEKTVLGTSFVDNRFWLLEYRKYY